MWVEMMQKILKNLESKSKLDKYLELYCTGNEDVSSTDNSESLINYILEDFKIKISNPDLWKLSKKIGVPMINLKDLK